MGATPSWDVSSTSQTSWVAEKSTWPAREPSHNSSVSTGLTLLSPSSAEQHSTGKLQFVELDEVPLSWRVKRSRNHGNSSYCCNVHQLLITRGGETFSWVQADRLLGDSLFNPLHFGSKTNMGTAPATKKQLERFCIFFHSRNSFTL